MSEGRIPVLVGGGQVNDRAAALDSLGLMAAAARRAGEDAGGGLLARTDWLGIVNQISCPEYNGRLVGLLSAELGITPAVAQETPAPTGDSPVLLVNEAANAIGRGEQSVALIVGGEALRFAAKRAAGGGGDVAEGLRAHVRPVAREVRHGYGLATPTDVYPLYENAGRAAYGQSLREGQAESARIWALMSQVAAGTESAWIRQPRSEAEIAEPSADNRPIAFPYTKLMVANASVNQGAAVLVTSLALAREAGVPEERIVYIGRGAAAHEDEDPLRRASFADSPAMQVSLQQALSLNGLAVEDIDHVELYSCFPCVPKMARRVLRLSAERPVTVFGGLTFGGGPIGNYMTHAAASMAEALRRDGRHGLLFANGGYATHNHTLLLTRVPQPDGTFPQDFDVQAQADAARGAVPELDDAYTGPARVETYTVIYGRDGAPRFGVVIGRGSDGRRVIGGVPAEDGALLHWLTSGEVEPVGAPGWVVGAGERNRWQAAAP